MTTRKKLNKSTIYIHGVPVEVEYHDTAELGQYFLDNFSHETGEVDRTDLSLLDGAEPNVLAENQDDAR